MTSTTIESTSIEARAAVFSALGDPIRLRILDVLGRDQHCVCDLQEQVDIAPNLLSYHLRVLREAGLIEGQRRGRWVDYRIVPEARCLVDSALPPKLAEGRR